MSYNTSKTENNWLEFKESVVGYGAEDSGKSIIKKMILKTIEYKMVIKQTD